MLVGLTQEVKTGRQHFKLRTAGGTRSAAGTYFSLCPPCFLKLPLKHLLLLSLLPVEVLLVRGTFLPDVLAQNHALDQMVQLLIFWLWSLVGDESAET